MHAALMFMFKREYSWSVRTGKSVAVTTEANGKAAVNRPGAISLHSIEEKPPF